METTQHVHTGVFDFFGLSRGLRDNIYDLTPLVEEEIFDGHHDCHEWLNDCKRIALKPDTDLLLINRQFGTEYKERCQRRSVLTIEDHHEYDYSRRPISGQAASVATLKLGLWIGCPRDTCFHKYRTTAAWTDRQIARHLSWMPFVISQMNDLRNIDIVFGLCSHMKHFARSYKRLNERLADYTSLSKVKSLKAYMIERAYYPANRYGLVAYWKPGDTGLTKVLSEDVDRHVLNGPTDEDDSDFEDTESNRYEDY